MKYEPRCTRCLDWLFTADEMETGICDHCADIMYEKYLQTKDWNLWHG